ncbi:unnamed protein product [Cylicocyclus nassatus]|uniref:Uncharacterized protein n=1 Tax=Cylicocyclus nassatus TaxID=53992 RepID=A0AA36GLQ9_CYLNA|nr:unnamed protein product [Cylicocyclus nassatus]
MAAGLQIILAIVMFLTTAIAGFLPIKLLSYLDKKQRDNKKHGTWLSLLSCFSGGVFLGTCFLDIIPHINENYEDFKLESNATIEFPLPQFCTCIGFFLVYLIEEICMKVFSMKHDHHHSSSVVKVEKAPPPPPGPPTHKENLNLRSCEALLKDNCELPRNGCQTHRFSLVMEETANYAVADPHEGSLLKSITFAVAMSFHSILEGFALGVQSTTARIVTLFVSLILHKGVEAFSVGLQISKGNSDKLKAVVATILVYALMTPLGSGLGTLLQLSNISKLWKDGAVLILESLAAGTFIYVTFLEVLAQEKDKGHNSLKQLLAIFIGFGVVAGLQLAFGDHDGGHEGPHLHTIPLTSTPLPLH